MVQDAQDAVDGLATERTCQACKTAFAPKGWDDWLCFRARCRGLREAGRQCRIVIRCRHCQEALPSAVRGARTKGRKRQQFCSRDCRTAHHNKLRTKARERWQVIKYWKHSTLAKLQRIADEIGVSVSRVRCWLGLRRE
jgi:hypothetical protein